MNDEEILLTNIEWGNDFTYHTYSGGYSYNFTNSLINDAMMDGMNWREIMSVYIEHGLVPENLRNKIVHNK